MKRHDIPTIPIMNTTIWLLCQVDGTIRNVNFCQIWICQQYRTDQQREHSQYPFTLYRGGVVTKKAPEITVVTTGACFV